MFADLNIIFFIFSLIWKVFIFGMNLDAIKDKMNSVKNYHSRYSPRKQKEQVYYFGVPIIQGLSLPNWREISEVL